ncbi:MAG TPA: hypothetical protein ENK85_00065 [Saprospiraceae bacterium]|nr:hypothetical protein [Saprospiraceae bacterium]
MIHFYIDLQGHSFEQRIKYVFDFIAHHPLSQNKVSFYFNAPNQTPSISYGQDQTGTYHIPRQHLIFNIKPIHPNQLVANQYQSNDLTLYSTEREKRAKDQPFINDNIFNFDIIETIFFHISRYEEHIIRPDMKENWGLGFKENHFIPRNHLQEIPIVDHLVFAFLEAIGIQPEKQKTTYRLTHDVDIPLKLPNFYKLIKASGRLLLIEHKGLKAQWNLFRTYLKMMNGRAKDPYDTFDWLFRKEAMEKVVYFMAGGVTKYDNFYKIDSGIGRRVIRQAQEKGYKIGLHPSYQAYKREDLYKREKQALEKVLGEKVILARQHYLRFQFPETADIIDNQGITEDSTLGYRDMIGFRCGTGFGYKLYSFKEERAYEFVETPLIIMEWSLIEQENQDMGKIKKHLETFLEKNQFYTKVTFLFHNSIFDMVGDKQDTLKEIYLSLINKVLSRHLNKHQSSGQ